MSQLGTIGQGIPLGANNLLSLTTIASKCRISLLKAFCMTHVLAWQLNGSTPFLYLALPLYRAARFQRCALQILS